MEPRRDTKVTLAIEHVDYSTPPAFKVTRLASLGTKSLSQIEIGSPYEFGVEGRPNSNLMRELRWYLEHFLDYPFDPETLHAETVLDALKAWGTQTFNALFDRRDAGDWLAASSIVQIRSDDPAILSWPWEALYDPQSGTYIAHQRRVERQLNRLPDPPALVNLPKDRVNILLVVARPYSMDVGYRSISRPLVELITSKALPAHVDVLRPPTFYQLRDHLQRHPNYYHVLHFDGHGSYAEASGQYSPHQYRGREGCLVFENEAGEPDPKSANDLNVLLHEHALPAVVLNACQSATLDETTKDPFATVATSLLRSGVRSVVAMGYSLYVSGAQVFLPALYRRLFERGSIAEAVLAGRQQMFAEKGRVSARGLYPLDDWLLPVLYQQAPVEFDFVAQARSEPRESHLPEEVRRHVDEYGFIGRDGPILAMERALRRRAPCILLQGLGGVGKTALARGFLRWLDETGGLDTALWFDFRDIRSSAYVINRTGEVLCGPDFKIGPKTLDQLANAMKETRLISVWDNFESTASNLPEGDREELGRFLDAIRATETKVILTSRSQEEWLGASSRFVLRLGGLDGEERWAYCDAILRDLGLHVDRNDPQLSKLMNMLGGHPLAMRVVLLRLERMTATRIIEALRANIAELGLNENEEQGRLFATLRFVETGLPEELRPLISLIGLHEGSVSSGAVEEMAKQIDPDWTRSRIDRLTVALASAGLLWEVGNDTFEMHPLFAAYQRSRDPATEQFQRAFVNVMASGAHALAPRVYHDQRVPFQLHGPNFRTALQISKSLAMSEAVDALTLGLGIHEMNAGNLIEASTLLGQLAENAGANANPRREASAYHLLGMVQANQRNFDAAQSWYFRSLSIKETLGDLHGAAATYHEIGYMQQRLRNFDEARSWHLKSLANQERLGNAKGIANSYHHLGMAAHEQRDFVRAEIWYAKSLDLSRRCGDQHALSTTLHEMALIAEEQHDLTKAKSFGVEALGIRESYRDEEGIAVSCQLLGKVARQQKEYTSAQAYFSRSLDIKERMRNQRGFAITYHELGLLAQDQRAFSAAQDWYHKSATVSESIGESYLAAMSYHQLGMIAQEKGEFRTAWDLYCRSLGIKEKQGNLFGAAHTWAQLGVLSAQIGNIAESGKWFTRSIAAFQRVKAPSQAKLVTGTFISIYSRVSPSDKHILETIWQAADIGPLTDWVST